MESDSLNSTAQVPTELLRSKIRSYSREVRERLRANESDALRFGLGEIQAKIQQLESLTSKDVCGLAARIKRRKHATVDDMYRLSYAFLQDMENICAFAKTTGALQVLVKELSGKEAARQLAAAECICNLSLGEAPVCEKIAAAAGGYLVTYLDAIEQKLKRLSLWTLANLLATGGKCANTLMQMQLLPKLWQLYTADQLPARVAEHEDFRIDAGVCLQIIARQAKPLLSAEQLQWLRQRMTEKNPTCPAAEFHLELVFNCDLCSGKLEREQQLYFINYALRSLLQDGLAAVEKEASATATAANLQELLYAVRVLGNLLAASADACLLLLEQLSSVWQHNLPQLLNRLFELRNAALTKELFWMLKNFLSHNVGGIEPESFLKNLRIYEE